MIKPQRRLGSARHPTTSPTAQGGLLWSAIIAFIALLILASIGPGASIYEANGLGTTLRQVGYFLVFGVAVVSFEPWRNPRTLLVVPWPLMLALGWCWLSLSWSIEPLVSFKKLLLLTLTLSSIFLLVRRIGADQAIAITRVTLATLLIINYFAVAVFPSYGIHQSDDLVDGALFNSWRGLMGHKNIAGFVCVVTVLFFSFGGGKIGAVFRVIIIALAVIFLGYSQSKTSIGVGAIAFLVGAVATAIRQRLNERGGARRRTANAIAAVAFLGPMTALIFLTLVPSIPMSWFSNASGLTGRFLIWQPLLRYYISNPVFGAGYGAFWTGLPSSPIKVLSVGWVRDIYEGHNGYFDLLITVGLPGVAIILFAVLAWPIRRWMRAKSVNPSTAGLVVAIIVFCVGHNGTEPSLFDRDALGQVYLILAISILSNLQYSKIESLKASRRANLLRSNRSI